MDDDHQRARLKIYKLLKIYQDQPNTPEGQTAKKRAYSLMEKYGFAEHEFLQTSRTGYPPPGAPSLTGNPEFDQLVGRFVSSVADLLRQQRQRDAAQREYDRKRRRRKRR